MKFVLALFILIATFSAGAKTAPAKKPVKPAPKSAAKAVPQDDFMATLMSGQIVDYKKCHLQHGNFLCEEKTVGGKILPPLGSGPSNFSMMGDDICFTAQGFVQCTGDFMAARDDWYYETLLANYHNDKNAVARFRAHDDLVQKVFHKNGDILWFGEAQMVPEYSSIGMGARFRYMSYCWQRPSGFYCNDDLEHPVQGVSDIRTLRFGKFDGCGIDETGRVVCGADPSMFDSHHLLFAPTEVASSPDFESTFGCAIDRGEVKCWGNDAYGAVNVPQDLVDPSHLGVGTHHACVLSQNRVRCWGLNQDGQTDTHDDQIKNPRGLYVRPWGNCVLDDDGIKCWGRNQPFQLVQSNQDPKGPVLELLSEGLGCYRTQSFAGCLDKKEVSLDLGKAELFGQVDCSGSSFGSQVCKKNGLTQLKWPRKLESASGLASYLQHWVVMLAEVQFTADSMTLIYTDVDYQKEINRSSPSPQNFAHPVWLRLRAEDLFQDLQNLPKDLHTLANKSAPLAAKILNGFADLAQGSSAPGDRFFLLQVIRPYVEGNQSAVFKSQIMPAFEAALTNQDPHQQFSKALVLSSTKILLQAMRPLADQAGAAKIDTLLKLSSNPSAFWKGIEDQNAFLSGLVSTPQNSFAGALLTLCKNSAGGGQ